MLNWTHILRVGAFFGILVFTAGPLSARLFTDKKGNTYDGTVANMTDTQVTLMVPAKGKFYKIAIEDLSAGDQAYIKVLRNKPKISLPSKPKPSLPSKPKKLPKQTAQPKVKDVSSNPRLLKTSELKAKYRLVDNYLTSWPKLVSIPKRVHVRVISEDKANKRYVYHSQNYEFICDVALSSTIISCLLYTSDAADE